MTEEQRIEATRNPIDSAVSHIAKALVDIERARTRSRFWDTGGLAVDLIECTVSLRDGQDELLTVLENVEGELDVVHGVAEQLQAEALNGR